GPRKYRHSVVGLLPKERALIAALLKDIEGKLVVGAFCFLHAQHVWPNFIEPANDIGQTSQDGVNVPGCDQHLRFVLRQALERAFLIYHLTFLISTSWPLCHAVQRAVGIWSSQMLTVHRRDQNATARCTAWHNGHLRIVK